MSDDGISTAVIIWAVYIALGGFLAMGNFRRIFNINIVNRIVEILIEFDNSFGGEGGVGGEGIVVVLNLSVDYVRIVKFSRFVICICSISNTLDCIVVIIGG